jgi:hypothetical protein
MKRKITTAGDAYECVALDALDELGWSHLPVDPGRLALALGLSIGPAPEAHGSLIGDVILVSPCLDSQNGRRRIRCHEGPLGPCGGARQRTKDRLGAGHRLRNWASSARLNARSDA